MTPVLPKPGRVIRASLRALQAAGMDDRDALATIGDVAGLVMRRLHDSDAGRQWAFQIQAQIRTRQAQREDT